MAGKNTRVNILVEGQTEETFVRELLAPHLSGFAVWITPRIIETSKGHKGGVVSYKKMVRQINRWCLQDQTATVTSLFDVYGLPNDFPNYANWDPQKTATMQVAALEKTLFNDVGQSNFIPYLQLHEYEALLFSNLDAFLYADVSSEVISKWKADLQLYSGPEDVNNSRETAPSKRLIAHWPKYKDAKPHFGVLLAIEIGLQKMRDSCPRFNEWLTILESL